MRILVKRGSKYQTILVFKWGKQVQLQNCTVSGRHFKTEPKSLEIMVRKFKSLVYRCQTLNPVDTGSVFFCYFYKCASQYNVLVWLCCLGVLCLKCPYINITRQHSQAGFDPPVVVIMVLLWRTMF